jgi:uncharacterized protein YdeI (YjbR/CyaY-like superfamily)
MKFQAKVIPSGNALAVVIPTAVMKTLGSEARPLIAITINGHQWRSRVALKNGKRLIGISAANRVKSGIAEGEVVPVELERDNQPRVVTEPADLAKALKGVPPAREAFNRLPFGLKNRYVNLIQEAKTPETRQRRIAKLVVDLCAGKTKPF